MDRPAYLIFSDFVRPEKTLEKNLNLRKEFYGLNFEGKYKGETYNAMQIWYNVFDCATA